MSEPSHLPQPPQTPHTPDVHDADHSHSDDHHNDPAEIRKHVRFYIGIFGVLLLLTFLTVGIAQIHIGPEHTNVPNIIVGLMIATLKATLVAAFFMHLSTEKKLITCILVFTAAFALALMFLTLLAFFDPITVSP